MKTLKELKEAITNRIPIIWDDPDPIEGTDYTITDVEGIEEDDFDNNCFINICYNSGNSEAQVFLHEIKYKL